jgi:guanylate kinase
MMLYIAINITAMLITKLKNKGKIFMVKNKIVVLLGKSASGKTTILNKLVDETNLGLNRWVSYTTRPRRQNEVNGYDYHFIPLETFKTLSLVDEKVYHTNVNGHSETWYYGHTDEPNTIDKDFIVIADPDGFRQLIKRYGRNRIFAVYIDCDEGIRKIRCKHRKDFDETEWERRAKDDEKVFEDIYKEERPFFYRHKVMAPIQENTRGFYELNSRKFTNIKTCLIENMLAQKIISKVLEFNLEG